MKKGDVFFREFRITEKVYRGFIDIFEDRNPLHTDRAFAQRRGFRAEVMHGNILAGFLSFFIGECLPTKSVVIHSQHITYLEPAYLGDRLTFSAVILDVFESVNVVEFGFEFANAAGVRLAKGRINIGVLE
jgi:3-hydroxybutyryl-CoA dehydratase